MEKEKQIIGISFTFTSAEIEDIEQLLASVKGQDDKAIGRRLQICREKANLTQPQLAEKLTDMGMPCKFYDVSNFEHNRNSSFIRRQKAIEFYQVDRALILLGKKLEDALKEAKTDGDKLKITRLSSGLSLQEMAKKIGLDLDAYNQLEAGKSLIQSENIEKTDFELIPGVSVSIMRLATPEIDSGKLIVRLSRMTHFFKNIIPYLQGDLEEIIFLIDQSFDLLDPKGQVLALQYLRALSQLTQDEYEFMTKLSDRIKTLLEAKKERTSKKLTGNKREKRKYTKKKKIKKVSAKKKRKYTKRNDTNNKYSKDAKNTNSDNQKENDTKETEAGKAPIVIKNNSLETFSEKENRVKATKKLAIILEKRKIRLNQLSEDEIEKHFADHALTNVIIQVPGSSGVYALKEAGLI